MSQFPGGYSPIGSIMPNTGNQGMMNQGIMQMQQQVPQGPNNQSPSQNQPHQQQMIPSGNSATPLQSQLIQQNQNTTVPHLMGLTKLGQETVQDIISRLQEIFAALKVIQPTGSREDITENNLRTIRLLFKRLRILYEKCNDGYPQGMEFTQVESLIPYMDEPEVRQEPPQTEEYRKELQENLELKETILLRNRQIREIIDRTRVIIWEVNAMVGMRKS
ncbi:MED30 family protein [Megaselia abdita]